MTTFLRFVAAAALTILAGHLMPEVAGQTLAIGPIAIGAGLGALGGLLGGGGDQTATQRLDPATQRWIEQYLRPGGLRLSNAAAGIGAGIPGVDPGFGPESYRAWMNPYLQDVMDPTLAAFDRDSAARMNEFRKQATLSGSGRGGQYGAAQGAFASNEELNRALLRGGMLSEGVTGAHGLALSSGQHNLSRLGASQEMLANSTGPYGMSKTIEGNGAGWMERMLAGGASGATFGAGLQGPSAAGPSGYEAGIGSFDEAIYNTSAPYAGPSMGAMAPSAGPSMGPMAPRPPALSRYRFGDVGRRYE